MARKNRTVEDRQKSLQPVAAEPHFSLAGVRLMYARSGGKKFCCTINGYCRTQIFEFPEINFHTDSDEPHHIIYEARSVQACVVSNLVEYFATATSGRHYAISPSLRHVIGETEEKARSQQNGGVPVFLVIEECDEFTPVEMIKGECNIWDREGEEFLTAWHTVDGAWPELPRDQQLVNMILAGVRVAQQTPDPIRKYVDQNCLVTDDGRFVEISRPTISARLRIAQAMDANAFRGRVSEIKKVIATMERDIGDPHMALLINSMYCEEHKDDSYKRLQYLGLWQSLAEAGDTCLGYQGNVRLDNVAVAGKKTLRELTECRNDIAHWWTDTIDENFLADLQRTINELVHRRYF